MTRDEIQSRVQKAVRKVFGLEPEEDCNPEFSLIDDLGAEPIDFADLSHQLEKEFRHECEGAFRVGTDNLLPSQVLDSQPTQGEFFTDKDREGGYLLTEQGLAALKERLPDVDFRGVIPGRMYEVDSWVTVESAVNFVERKLRETKASSIVAA